MLSDLFFSAISIDIAHPKDPTLARMWGLGARTAAGIDITPEKALQYDAVWRGVNLLGNGVAKLPLSVIEQAEDGDKPAKAHPSYALVANKPNPEMTAGVFRKTLMMHALLWGNGYAHIARNGDAGAETLTILLPDRTKPVRLTGEQVKDTSASAGQLVYMTRVGGEWRKLLPENVLHIRGLGFDGLQGYAVVDLLREALGLGIAAQQFGARFFGQGATSAGIVRMPGGLTEVAAENFAKSVREAHSGLGKSHLLMVLEEGSDFQSTTIPPEQAQFLQTRKMELITVANVLGLPPHKLGHDARTSFNSLEQSNQEYLDDSLDPWLCAIEDEYSDKLLTEDEKRSESHVIRFDRDGLVRVNFKDRVAGVVSTFNTGLRTRNESRRRLGDPPSTDPNAERYRKPVNIDFEGDQLAVAPTVPAGEDARALVHDTLARCVKRLTVHAERAARNPGRFCAYVDNDINEHTVSLVTILEPVSRVLALDGQRIAEHVVSDVRANLDDCTRATAGELPDAVAATCAALLSSGIDDYTDYAIGACDETIPGAA